MGMPNIPNKIESEIKINEEEIMSVFNEVFMKNKITISKFFENEQEFIKKFRNSDSNLNQEQLKRVQNSFSEVKNIVKEKAHVDKEQAHCLQHLNKDTNKSTTSSFIYITLFILLLVIGYTQYN